MTGATPPDPPECSHGAGGAAAATVHELHALLQRWADEQNRLWRGEVLPPDAVTHALAEGFAAVQWAPWYEGQCWRGDAAAWLEGTRQAAADGAPVQWTVDVLRVLPRSDDEAVACYEVRVARDGCAFAASIFLETWRREQQRWRLVRHTAEKALLRSP